jgi:hypothetical protein
MDHDAPRREGRQDLLVKQVFFCNPERREVAEGSISIAKNFAPRISGASHYRDDMDLSLPLEISEKG